jgi:hypothetical protein
VRFVQKADGTPAIADDMPTATRAILLLIEHANQRRHDGLPGPCGCGECTRHRAAVRCTKSADGTTLIVEAT